jgi:hypothetical protein
MTPNFSPLMLKLFLRARISDAVFRAGGAEPSGRVRHDSTRKAKAAIRKAAGVTGFQFDAAWAGRLIGAEPRLKLWGALGLVPADHGVILTDDGGQQ